MPTQASESAGNTKESRGDISAVDVVHQLLHQAAGHRPLALRAGSQTRLLIALGVQGVSPQLACGLSHLLRLQLVTGSPTSLDHRGTHLLTREVWVPGYQDVNVRFWVVWGLGLRFELNTHLVAELSGLAQGMDSLTSRAARLVNTPCHALARVLGQDVHELVELLLGSDIRRDTG